MNDKVESSTAAEQRRALEEARGLTGQTWTGIDQLKSSLSNAITDKRDGSTDWLKIGLLSGGALLGGMLGSGLAASGGVTGFLALGVGALLGAGVMTLVNDLIVNFFRDVKKPSAPPRLDEEVYPKANEKVISQNLVKLPELPGVDAAHEGAQIDIPRYDPSQNPELHNNLSLLDARRSVDRLRKLAEQGKPFTDSDNSAEQAAVNAELRDLVKRLDEDSKRKEINLRFARDTLDEKLKAPNQQLDEYLAGIGLDEGQRAQFISRPNLSDIPGQHMKLPGDLEKYGQEVMRYYIAIAKQGRNGELAKGDGSTAYSSAVTTDPNGLTHEELKMAEDSWNLLSVGNKRVLIENFASHAKRASKELQGDYQQFFPEHKWGVPRTSLQVTTPGQLLNEYVWDNFEATQTFKGQLMAADAQAEKDHNWEPVADLLQKRLDQAREAKRHNQPILDDDKMQLLQKLILGMRADTNLKRIDDYKSPGGEFERQLKALDRFDREILPAHNAKVDLVQSRLQTLEQTKLFVLSESKVRDHSQQIVVQDARGSTPQQLTFDITYADDAGKVKNISLTDGSGKTRTLSTSDITIPSDAAQRAERLEKLLPLLEAAPLEKKVTLNDAAPEVDFAKLLADNKAKPAAKEAAEPSEPVAPLAFSNSTVSGKKDLGVA